MSQSVKPAPPPLVVRVNTFIQPPEKHYIDPLSRVFIITEFAIGLNRIPVLGDLKSIYIKLTIIYTLLLIGVVFYLSFTLDNNLYELMVIKCFQLLFCSIYGLVAWKRMRRYYDELNKFDKEVGSSSKITSESIIIVIEMIIILTFITFLLIYNKSSQFIPAYLIYALEINYTGHLLNLLTQRIRIINNHIEASMANSIICASTKVEVSNFSNDVRKTRHFEMCKLIDFYQILIDAYTTLIDAIKWQFLVMLTTSFYYILCQSTYIATLYIDSRAPFIDTLPDLGLALTEMVPLLAPCMCSDQIRAEVRRLRELLASKLYENKIDKRSRSIARALLALTETRNLSFSLLRMVDISISLPFTFLGLIITYLIIILQFKKVMGP